MKRAWRPVYDMKGASNEVKPDIKVKSREEFFESFDFTYMSERLIDSVIYDNIIKYDSNDRNNIPVEAKDDEGYILYKDGIYIPTVHDEGVYIERAFLRDSRYSEKYSFLDKIELVVVERSGENVKGTISGFQRTNIFRKNEEDEWFLYSIEGFVSYGI
ncbi:MAG: hypothetical protein WCZ27_08370 [Tissierellaceae bacterium]